MKANLKGKVLEKFTRDVTNGQGQKVERMYVRLYQPGERVNIDVSVKANVYADVKDGQVIELNDVNVTAYNNALYARQE